MKKDRSRPEPLLKFSTTTGWPVIELKNGAELSVGEYVCTRVRRYRMDVDIFLSDVKKHVRIE